MHLQSEKVKIIDLLSWRQGGILSVNTEYQRGAVWNEAQQKKLIDSVLRGYPLPLIYLHHKKRTIAGITNETFEIIDGQQRLNALHKFSEDHLILFDPVIDDKVARFPKFVKESECDWARKSYEMLSPEFRNSFNQSELFIVKVTTSHDDEARDLFIRLQAGMPLNAQEKRDAWPGGFTEFVLKYGGKKEISRYPGHEFFRTLVSVPASDRGGVRTLCAQMAMLYFEDATKGNWLNLSTQPIDDYYYQNLSFDVTSDKVMAFSKNLQIAVDIFRGYKGQKLKVHEALHVYLLLNDLAEGYTNIWQGKFIEAFEEFRYKSALDKKEKQGEYWSEYVSFTIAQASVPASLEKRHNFFAKKMLEILNPIQKDTTRAYGPIEREIIYYQYRKKCVVCQHEIAWLELDIHHLDEHQNGGKTTLENGVPVHKTCHPKGPAALEFYKKWSREGITTDELQS